MSRPPHPRRAPSVRLPVQCAAVAGVLVTACGSAAAQPVELAAGRLAVARPVGSVEVERVDPQLDAPTASTARLYRIDQTPTATVPDELRTRWWLHHGAGGVGAGADWAATSAGSTLRPWRPVFGVRADLAPQTRLLYEVRAAAAPWSPAGLPGGGHQEMRVAMEFKSARNPAQNLRNGLLRVQLSNSSALWLKPRSGGLVVSYRSQF